ncbi:MAG: PBP1A family penicillin-binding protein [Candidatus Saccharimonadales bacterium]
MARQGKYTRKQNPAQRSQYFFKRNWQNFKAMSRRKKILVIATPIAAFLILTPIITYLALARDISDPERLMNRNNTGVEFVDKNGETFFSSGASKSLKRLQLSEISDFAEKAVISSEDKNFYQHGGISITSLLAALYANVLNRDATAYGGSTLTQQLVKNTLLSTEKSFFRKYQEVAMAVAVDRQYTKDEVLDLYLNSVYYGEGAFGIEEAAKTYFNKSANDLTLAESAMLAGVLPAPGVYSPINGDAEKAKQRQTYVLRRMVEDGKITSVERDAALAQTLTYADVSVTAYDNAPHFAEMVMAELYDKYGEERIKRSGYKVKTTLDLNWQREAESIVSKQIALSTAGGGRNAAMVAIDPKTGYVRALVGSVDYNNPTFGKVNMAIASRQPGSSFKPIYITEAIDQKLFTAATIIEDKATDFGGYKPENYDFKFRGNVTLRSGLAQSLNIPAVKVMEKLGVDEAIDKAREMGLDTIDDKTDYGLSLALGAGEVKPLDMTNAYAAFANAGRQYEPTLIELIESKYGDTIFKASSNSKRVQSSEASFIMSDILSDNTARAPSFGSRLNIPGRDVAVKTGSTDDNRDAWTIGYTPSLAVGVWVGNNENEVMTSGGSAMAGPIWSKSMKAFLGDSPSENFAQPSSVIKTNACSSSNAGYEEFFIKGTEPDKSCNIAPQPTEEQVTSPEAAVKDTDGDGVLDDKDKCPAVGGTNIGSDGCPKVDPATIDTDGDGVTDNKDKCSSTPSGTTVDNQGCPVVVPPVTDTDGDGVTNVNDDCPNTPAGATVDANGCSAAQLSAISSGSPEYAIAVRRYA